MTDNNFKADWDYPTAVDFIHSIARFGSKPGLRRVQMLLERMGNPQKKLKYIHVAGTNGKGSTCSMISNMLIEAGYKTGLYISPFVVEFRERIQFCGEMIDKQDLADCTAYVKGFWDDLNRAGETPTEFEVLVAVAIEYFVRKECDIVVLEVGMGGRFDATNIIDTPLASVITSIGIDHTQYLGNTTKEIAFEKCGIIKQGGQTICYPRQDIDALAVIMEECAKKENTLIMGSNVEILKADITGTTIVYDNMKIAISMAGEHQVWNAVTAIETVKAIGITGFAVPEKAILQGIKRTKFPARLEILGEDPLVLLDGAHNYLGAQVLSKALEMLAGKKIHAVIGLLADKDVDGVLGLIMQHLSSLTTTSPQSPRAMGALELAGHAQKIRSLPQGIFYNENPLQAYKEALARCEKEDVLLVCGSLYLASDLREIALNMSNNV